MWSNKPPDKPCETWIRTDTLKQQPAKWDGSWLWTRFGPLKGNQLDGYQFCRIPTPEELQNIVVENAVEIMEQLIQKKDSK